MNLGKISETVLKRSVLKEIKYKRNDVIQGAGICADCAVIDISAGEVIVSTTDIISVYAEGMEKVGVYSVINDLAALAATPVGVMLNILLPANFEEQSLRKMMESFNEALSREDMQIIGGHTEYTDSVKNPVITINGIGKTRKNNLKEVKNIKPYQDIVMTKSIGIEGTYRIYLYMKEKLAKRFSPGFINKITEYGDKLSTIPEAAVAIKHGVTAMHDLSEGGIFAALWDIASVSNKGLDIELKAIPVQQETIEVCELFDINPYQFPSGGSMLIVCDNGVEMVNHLEKENIKAVVIGKIIPGNDKILNNNGEKRFLDSPKSGELLKIFS